MPAAFNTNCGPYSADEPPATVTSNAGCTVDGAGGTQQCSCAPFYHSWSASTVGGSPGQAWLECYTVTGNGLSAPDKMTPYNVRAVRGGATAAITCSPTPAGGCLSPGRSVFTLMSNSMDAGRDRLRWSWSKGVAVSTDDLGDPTAATEYALCVYANGSLLAHAIMPPGQAWRALGGTPATGYRYSDRAGTSNGITKARVFAGADQKTKASVIGKGLHLPAIGLPLAQAQLPITVQLVNNNTMPQCWSASYANPPTSNNGTRFKVQLP